MLLLILAMSVACSAVGVRGKNSAFVEGGGKRLDVSTSESLDSLGFNVRACERRTRDCLDLITNDESLAVERRLPIMAELAMTDAHASERAHAGPRQVLDRYVEVARLGFAYLFFVNVDARQPDRLREQARMRHLYNLATERVVTLLFEVHGVAADPAATELVLERTRLKRGRIDVRLPRGQRHPVELVPASGLEFDGVRNAYHRQGIGAALVAVADPAKSAQTGSVQAGSLHEARFLPATAIVRFPGGSLQDVMRAREAIVDVCDPYQCVDFEAAGRRMTLAANFTAPYALWLSRSRFARQADRALLNRESALTSPRVYLLQPYDPKRRIVVLLHGLGSSPDGWVDLANDILGDDTLRRHYQLWQVFYPTNLPIAESREKIRGALLDAITTLDPEGTAPASDRMTLVGHSMGGVISRLLVVESRDVLWEAFLGRTLDARQRQKLALLDPYLSLEPMPQVDRIILLASPHRGSPTARGWLGRAASKLVRLPVTALNTVATIADAIQHDAPDQAEALRGRQMDSIETLGDQGKYLHAAATLPIAEGVAYHSIIGRNDPGAALETSTDGIVPYSSSHLEGAVSELIVTSGHGVQGTPEAILEVRRILRTAAVSAAAEDRRIPHASNRAGPSQPTGLIN